MAEALPSLPDTTAAPITVMAQRHVLAAAAQEWSTPSGGTLRDIVRSARSAGLIDKRFIAEDGLPVKGFTLHVVLASRDGKVPPAAIPSALWHKVRPKPGMVVSLALRPGKGDGKSPLRIILTIVVLVAAAWAASAFAPMLAQGLGLGTTFAVETGSFFLPSSFGLALSKGIIAGAVTMVGSLLTNTLAPPPKPTQSAISGRSGTETVSQQFSLSGVRNAATPFGPVPDLFGRARLTFPRAAEPMMEVVGDQTYVRMIFDCGYGPIRWTDLRLGNQPLDQVSDDYELEIREGWPDDQPITLYTETPVTESLSLPLRFNEPQIVELRDAVEMAFDITFDRGLGYITDSGAMARSSVTMKVEYRPAGSATWSVVRQSANVPEDQSHFDGPWYLETNPDVAASNYYGSRPYAHYVDYGQAEGRVARWLPSDSFGWSAATNSITLRGGRCKLPQRGDYQLRFTRLTADSTDGRLLNDFKLSAIRSILPGSPIKKPLRSQIAVRFKIGPNFNGTLDQLNGIGESYCPVYNDGAWTYQVTRNQAWLALKVLRGRGNHKPVPDDELDLPYWVAFAARNDRLINGKPAFTYDHAMDYRTSVLQKVNDILATARAQLAYIDGKYRPIWDAPRDDEVPAYVAPENCWGFAREVSFVELPHALRVRYLVEGVEKEVIVYRDGYSPETATLYEVIELEGCSDADLAWREGCYWFDVAQRRRAKSYFSMSVEHLNFTLGKLLEVWHPRPKWGGETARIKTTIVNDGGAVIAVTLDKPVTMQAGKSYAARIRVLDNRTVYEPVASVSGEVSTLTFTAPIAALDPLDPDTLPHAGDLVMFGELEVKGKRLIVREIRRQGIDNARIECIDEAPEVHLADRAAMPPISQPLPVVALGVPPDAVTDLQLTELITYANDQAVASVMATWRPAPGVVTSSYEVWRFENGIWNFLGPVTTPQYGLRVKRVGEVVRLAVVAVSASGLKLPVLQSASAALTPQGDKSLPGDIRRLTIEETARGTRRLNGEFDRKPTHAGIEFRFHAGNNRDWESARPMQQAGTLISELPFETELLASGIYTVMAKAVDASGNKSRNAAFVIVDLGARAFENIIEAFDLGAAGFLGTAVGGEVEAGEVLATDPGTPGWADGATPAWSNDNDPAWSFDADIGWSADAMPAWTNDSDPAWSTIYSGLTYSDGFEVGAAGFLTLQASGDGAMAILYRNRDSGPGWSNDGDAAWSDDAAPAWSVADWIPYSGPVRTTVGRHEVRVEIPSGPVRGRIVSLTALLDLDDQIESIEDLVVPLEGIRLPLTKEWHSIINIVPTVQHDGNGATSIRVVDKDPDAGPLIFAVNDNNEVVAGLFDLLVHGAKR